MSAPASAALRSSAHVVALASALISRISICALSCGSSAVSQFLALSQSAFRLRTSLMQSGVSTGSLPLEASTTSAVQLHDACSVRCEALGFAEMLRIQTSVAFADTLRGVLQEGEVRAADQGAAFLQISCQRHIRAAPFHQWQTDGTARRQNARRLLIEQERCEDCLCKRGAGHGIPPRGVVKKRGRETNRDNEQIQKNGYLYKSINSWEERGLSQRKHCFPYTHHSRRRRVLRLPVINPTFWTRLHRVALCCGVFVAVHQVGRGKTEVASSLTAWDPHARLTRLCNTCCSALQLCCSALQLCCSVYRCSALVGEGKDSACCIVAHCIRNGRVSFLFEKS